MVRLNATELDRKFLKRYAEVCTPEELKLLQMRARVTVQNKMQKAIAESLNEKFKTKFLTSL